MEVRSPIPRHWVPPGCCIPTGVRDKGCGQARINIFAGAALGSTIDNVIEAFVSGAVYPWVQKAQWWLICRKASTVEQGHDGSECWRSGAMPRVSPGRYFPNERRCSPGTTNEDFLAPVNHMEVGGLRGNIWDATSVWVVQSLPLVA